MYAWGCLLRCADTTLRICGSFLMVLKRPAPSSIGQLIETSFQSACEPAYRTMRVVIKPFLHSNIDEQNTIGVHICIIYPFPGWIIALALGWVTLFSTFGGLNRIHRVSYNPALFLSHLYLLALAVSLSCVDEKICTSTYHVIVTRNPSQYIYTRIYTNTFPRFVEPVLKFNNHFWGSHSYPSRTTWCIEIKTCEVPCFTCQLDSDLRITSNTQRNGEISWNRRRWRLQQR